MDSGARLDVLRQQFAEYHLLGKKLGSHGDGRRARALGGSEGKRKHSQQKKGKKADPEMMPALHETRSRRSSIASSPSAISASSAAGMAPARITASLTMATPRKINVPKPPAPIAAAIVATPIVMTVAVRIPARITESASGKRTRHITCHGVIPIAVAASSTAASIPVNPTYVFRRIGNNAYTTSATTAVRFPIPPING